MEHKTYEAKYFQFHIFNENKELSLILASNPNKYYVHPPANRDELKGLADFIYEYLENSK